jgi:flagellar biosynthesis/type III secretory pathway protein FliH
MAWRPQLNVVCGRCGKPREGLRHVCRSNSTRKATVAPKLTFGTCPKCRKPYGGNPLAHTCRPKSDFKKRKARAAKAEKVAARKKRRQSAHDYQACQDKDCARSLCVAFRTGRKDGYQDGYEDGYGAGYEIGFVEGIASCPRNHSG